MTENEIQKSIIDWCEARGDMVLRMNAGRTQHNVRLAPKGTPDLMCLPRGGGVYWIEVKQPGKKPTEDQLAMHKELFSRGHLVIVACSYEDVETALREVQG